MENQETEVKNLTLNEQVAVLRGVVDNIQVDEFKSIGEVFYSNLHDVGLLLILPISFFAEIEVKAFATKYETKIKTSYSHLVEEGKELSDAVVDDLIKAGLEDISCSPDFQSLISTRTQFAMDARAKLDPSWPAVQKVLNSSCIVLAWSAFEVLAHDLWVKAVNRYPDHLTNHMQLEKHSIKFSDLKSLDFNVSERLGDVLIKFGNFKFTGCDVIAPSYSAIFDDSFKSLRSELAKTNSKLFITEKKRHLIVHKSGIVDRIFFDLMHDQTGLTIGQPLTFTYENAVDALQSVADVGGKLLAFTDNYVKI